MFSADMANEEWELEISPNSRYYTEGELEAGLVRRRPSSWPLFGKDLSTMFVTLQGSATDHESDFHQLAGSAQGGPAGIF